MGIRAWLAGHFERLERNLLHFSAGAESLPSFLGRTEGAVHISAYAHSPSPDERRVAVQMLARSKERRFLHKWLLSHEHEVTRFESECGPAGIPGQDPVAFASELKIPLRNANVLVTHFAKQVEAAGRTAIPVVDRSWV